MRSVLFSIVVFALMSSKIIAQDLDVYQWKNRIILLKSNTFESDWLQAQLKRLNADRTQLEEREVLLLVITDDLVYNDRKQIMDLSADTIISTYDLSDFNGLILIGKDGGLKLKEAFIVNPKEIFSLIDSMPMRKTEITDSKGID
jgi:hypothetical protein